MNRKSLTSVLAFVLAAVLVVPVLPAPAQAARSSSAIQSELNALKDQNKAIQAEINSIQRKYDANANEIQDLVDKKNAIDQEISLLNAQIQNLNDQISVYSQMIADAQDELDIAQFTLNGLNEKHKLRIRAMEEEGDVSYWEVIFEANSFIDMLDRINMMQEIAASDQARLEFLKIRSRWRWARRSWKNPMQPCWNPRRLWKKDGLSPTRSSGSLPGSRMNSS